MAGNILIPQDLVKIFDIKYQPDLLLKFLTDLSAKVNDQQAAIEALEQRVKTLETL